MSNSKESILLITATGNKFPYSYFGVTIRSEISIQKKTECYDCESYIPKANVPKQIYNLYENDIGICVRGYSDKRVIVIEDTSNRKVVNCKKLINKE